MPRPRNLRAGVGFCEIGPGSRGCTTKFPPSGQGLMINAGRILFLDSNPDTIQRTNGSWLNDGFAVGMNLTVAGTQNNDGTYTVDAVTPTLLTVAIGDTLVAEEIQDSSSVTINAV